MENGDLNGLVVEENGMQSHVLLVNIMGLYLKILKIIIFHIDILILDINLLLKELLVIDGLNISNNFYMMKKKLDIFVKISYKKKVH